MFEGACLNDTYNDGGLPVSHLSPVDSNGGHVQVSGYEQVPPFMHGGTQSAGFDMEDLLDIVTQ